jgi:hypothetical protein
METVQHGSAQPNELNRNEIYIQHDPNSNKVFGVWAGRKNDVRCCVLPKKLFYPGDGQDHQILPEEKYIGGNSNASAVTMTLPDTSEINDGHEVIVEDVGGNAGSLNITVATYGSETVDAGSIATNGAKVHYMWDEQNMNWKDIS